MSDTDAAGVVELADFLDTASNEEFMRPSFGRDLAASDKRAWLATARRLQAFLAEREARTAQSEPSLSKMARELFEAVVRSKMGKFRATMHGGIGSVTVNVSGAKKNEAAITALESSAAGELP